MSRMLNISQTLDGGGGGGLNDPACPHVRLPEDTEALDQVPLVLTFYRAIDRSTVLSGGTVAHYRAFNCGSSSLIPLSATCRPEKAELRAHHSHRLLGSQYAS
jgi:hypothetical protein